MTLNALFTIHELTSDGVSINFFGETDFVEVQKSAKSVNFMAFKERAPYMAF